MVLRIKNFLGLFLIFAVMMKLGEVKAQANMDNLNVYKEAFEGSKPKCTFCHIDKLPKKTDGDHNLNKYGETLKDADGKVTVESIKAAGEAPAPGE